MTGISDDQLVTDVLLYGSKDIVMSCQSGLNLDEKGQIFRAPGLQFLRGMGWQHKLA